MHRLLAVALCLLLAVAAVLLQPAQAKRISDIRGTKHNLSFTGPGTLKAADKETTQVCVFCHTPHGAESIPNAPLWNRQLSAATYSATTNNTYGSRSIDADIAELQKGPGGVSKLCLSCHDGTMAISSVNVANGKTNQKLPLSNTGPGDTMSAVGVGTGYTRNLGTDMSNDHPISFSYTDAVATNDGELRLPSLNKAIVGTRVRAPDRAANDPKPLLPLDGQKMQCTTCHDPHLRDEDDPNAKFLRHNRLQKGKATGGFDPSDAGQDIICLACHNKGGTEWAYSAHANNAVATATFTVTAYGEREFASTTQVWQAACLNCHDTHTIPGARRLLRQGASGGQSAIEETCYQCHSSSTVLSSAQAPDIRTDFESTYHMPIKTVDQKTFTPSTSGPTWDTEVHNIGTTDKMPKSGADFYEEPALLGKVAGEPKNRHVECTDCHNPHRVIKKRLFTDDPSTAKTGDRGTHNHASGHTNIASGVLRGSYGVEPDYAGVATFGDAFAPTSFTVKKGIPTVNTANKSDAWVTREYQVCMKCHSRYAYAQPPKFGTSGGGTVPDLNIRPSHDRYTDQAMEFQAPSGHGGAATTTNSGAFNGVAVRRDCATATTTCTTNVPTASGTCTCANITLPTATNPLNFTNRNHRAWHPVMDSTGRGLTERGMGSSAFLAPWDKVGAQQMYCSDCHGSSTADTTVDPGTRPWGPHGSANPFILKGEWSRDTGAKDKSGTLNTVNGLCFKCHDSATYANGGNTGSGNANGSTAFFQADGSKKGNLHAFHADRIGKIRCTWCHVAVPHGWKNRSLLVNLNDVGPEGGKLAGTEIPMTSSGTSFSYGPYYNNAKLKLRAFAEPGKWNDTNCGSATQQGSDSTKAVIGKNWMASVCSSPP